MPTPPCSIAPTRRSASASKPSCPSRNASSHRSATDSTTLGVNALNFATQAGAQGALATIDTAIDSLSSSRATIGASQNRLVVTMNNLSSAHENLSAANSRIRDVDVAEEIASMTRNQILSQAGVAVLAQANQLPQAALSLLRG